MADSPGVSYTSTIPFSTSFGAAGPAKHVTDGRFPQVLATASSFNSTLFHLIGQTISTEARAFYNNQQANLTFWAPNINIFRCNTHVHV